MPEKIRELAERILGTQNADEIRQYIAGLKQKVSERMSEPLFDKEKVLNRVGGSDFVGNQGVLTSLKQYFTNSDTAVEDDIQKYIDAQREFAYLNGLSEDEYEDAVGALNEDERERLKLVELTPAVLQHEDAKRIYLGYPQKYGTMQPSPYQATKGTLENPHQVNALMSDGFFDNFILPAYAQWKTGVYTIGDSRWYNGKEFPLVTDLGETAQLEDVPILFGAGLSAGFDDKGQYLSLYDRWDYNTDVLGTNGDNVGKWIGGKPFDIYNRYYLDDYLDIPEEARGNPYIAPAYKMERTWELPYAKGGLLHCYDDGGQLNIDKDKLSELAQRISQSEKSDELAKYVGDRLSFARGGSIHIKPENRGKFTALKKRTGHSASWFKAHGTPAQKKMAVFELNARRWKHEDGGLLHQYDGESEPTAQMQVSEPLFLETSYQTAEDFIHGWYPQRTGQMRSNVKLANSKRTDVQSPTGKIMPVINKMIKDSDATARYIVVPDDYFIDENEKQNFTENNRYPLLQDSSATPQRLLTGNALMSLIHPASSVVGYAIPRKNVAFYSGDKEEGLAENTFLHELTHNLMPAYHQGTGYGTDNSNPMEIAAADMLGQVPNVDNLSDAEPYELVSRLNEARMLFGVNPKRTMTVDDIAELRKKAKEFGKEKGINADLFDKYDDATLLRFFNEIAQSAPIAIDYNNLS